MNIFEDKVFSKQDLVSGIIPKGEYDHCTFNDCDFSGLNFSEAKFIDCIFNTCNLSLMNIQKASFQNVKFSGCKMLGFRLDSCNDFGLAVSFENCVLTHACFYGKSLKKTLFKDCKLDEVDFTEANLAGAVFDECDLTAAVFENTVIENTDFRSSFNYSIDPELNNLKGAKFTWPAASGLLSKYRIDIQ